MNSACKLSLLATAVLLSVSVTFAEDAKGWYEGCCDIAVLHFTSYPGQTSGKALQIRHGGMPTHLLAGEGWYRVQGKLCDLAGKCEQASKAEIRVERATHKRVTGLYAVDVGGLHLTAHFSLKHKGTRCICE